jgi:beta-galactosidase
MNFTTRIMTGFLCLISVLSNAQSHQFALGNDAFLLDGKPFQMISGEMHYTRIPRDAWKHRMKMAKAMGLNTIGTYVFWNAHEPLKGKYDFSGNNDIAAFITAAKEEGLYVILRPSPYVCAEWEFGGYPWWLLKDSSVKVRSKDDRFISAYTNYINELAKHLTPLLVTHGGNVLMVQIENEYGSYSDDKSYMDLNRQLFRNAGFDCTLFTCDGADMIAKGYLPGYLPAVNGLEDTAGIKKVVNEFHGGKGPYYLAEWYPGWFDQWGKNHNTTSAEKNAAMLDDILTAGISVNMYMFHGGTTRGFMNGANMNVNDPYAPQTTSYDYDAPLDEAGNPSQKFHLFRNVISKHLAAGSTLPAIPENKKAIQMQDIQLTGFASLFSHLGKPVVSAKPMSFEDLDQAYGYVLYRTTLHATGKSVLKIDGLRDYAIVYINGKQVGVLDRRLKEDSLMLSDIPANAVLDIFVENNGRINYGPYLTDNRKGILGNVLLGQQVLSNWKNYKIPMSTAKNIRFAKKPQAVPGTPSLFKGEFMLNEVADTYFDLGSFGKGVVFLNGHHLGKYWNIGPQQTIYVPAEWLKKGKNEVIVLDELKTDHSVLSSSANPILTKPANPTK